MPARLDAIIIGAGAAGIAAGRVLRKAGASFKIIEARNRVGGRAAAITVKGRRIDTGAHWMHMAHANPLIPLAKALKIKLRPMPGNLPFYDGPRRIESSSDPVLANRWQAIEDSVAKSAQSATDKSVATYFPGFGEWTDTFAFNHSLYCGRSINEVSAFDYSRVEDSDNKFPAGPYADIIARLAIGLPVQLRTPVTAIGWTTRDGVGICAAGETLLAAQCVMTVPAAVLKAGTIHFPRKLPHETIGAIKAFQRGAYEHVILHWPDSPFKKHDRDRLVFFKGGRVRNMTLLAHIEGTNLHYAEVGGSHIAEISTPARRIAFVLKFLRENFGEKACQNLTAAHATDWWSDPCALASWSVTGPGNALARETMQHPVAGRLWFAGEASSPSQWGTVGGAWLEGERAAKSVLAAL